MAPSSGRYFSKETSLRHWRGKLFGVLVHMWMGTCAAPLYSDFWPLWVLQLLSFCPLPLVLLCARNRTLTWAFVLREKRWLGGYPFGD